MDLFSMFKGGKYFDKHMAPKCDYCQFGRRAKDGNKVLCEKRGLVDCNYSCNKFVYSPLKRIPVKQLNFVGSLADEDIYIESAGDIAEKQELENPKKKEEPREEAPKPEARKPVEAPKPEAPKPVETSAQAAPQQTAAPQNAPVASVQKQNETPVAEAPKQNETPVAEAAPAAPANEAAPAPAASPSLAELNALAEAAAMAADNTNAQ
jgi:outer membrane biosynthesis protein TonB